MYSSQILLILLYVWDTGFIRWEVTELYDTLLLWSDPEALDVIQTPAPWVLDTTSTVYPWAVNSMPGPEITQSWWWYLPSVDSTHFSQCYNTKSSVYRETCIQGTSQYPPPPPPPQKVSLHDSCWCPLISGLLVEGEDIRHRSEKKSPHQKVSSHQSVLVLLYLECLTALVWFIGYLVIAIKFIRSFLSGHFVSFDKVSILRLYICLRSKGVWSHGSWNMV